MQTYQNAIETMLSQSVILPTDLFAEIEKFIEENKHRGGTTIEGFIRDAARWKLKFLKEGLEYVEVPREKYESLEVAVKEMNIPYHSASDFIQTQIEEELEKYDKYSEEEHRKASRKRS
jgi:metal-responsive CopG/Arc/MetJ family transcriptional regulator